MTAVGELDADRALRMYRAVATAVACDTKMWTLLNSGQISLFYLSARGHEVLGAAAGVALEGDDYLIPYYRSLTEELAKGMSLPGIWAEWSGKATGVCRGRSGSVHLTDPDANIMMNSGIIGGQLPVANGFALASQMRGDGRVTMCTFGDGANNEGAFHEALNLAALWKLPVVFLCQNNLYAESTAFHNQTCVPQVADRAAAYGIPGIVFDGNDAEASFRAIHTAVERARRGEGPSLLEGMTYRLAGHYNLDSMSYMPEDELAAAREADPVPVFRALLVERGFATQDELTQIEEDAKVAVDEAHRFGVESPVPEPSDLLVDVLAALS